MIHQKDEFIEKRIGIMGSRRRLGVVLNAEGRKRRIADPLRGVIVQIVPDRFDLTGERVGQNDKTVVLRGDFDPSVASVLDGLVDPVMAELQLCRPSAHRLPQDLVSQTDAEDRNLSQDCPDRPDDIRQRRRIPGAVGEQNAGPTGEDLIRCRGCRKCWR